MELKEKYKSLTKGEKILFITQGILILYYTIHLIDIMFFNFFTKIKMINAIDYLNVLFSYIVIILFIIKLLPLIIKGLKGVFFGKKEDK